MNFNFVPKHPDIVETGITIVMMTVDITT